MSCPNCNSNVASDMDICGHCGVSRARFLAIEDIKSARRQKVRQAAKEEEHDSDANTSATAIADHFRDILLYLCGIIGVFVLLGLIDGDSLTEAQSEDVCRAAMAHVMGRPLDIVSAKSDGFIVDVSYYRDDGKFYRYQCIAQDGSVKWQTNQYGKLGRWRGGQGDGRLSYELIGDRKVLISETWGDGSGNKRQYRVR